MKIAQVAPLYEAVPPRLYGGTERVVAHLTDALVSLGHEVTLFASGEAQTRAKLVFLVEGRPAPDAGAGLHPGQPIDVRPAGGSRPAARRVGVPFVPSAISSLPQYARWFHEPAASCHSSMISAGSACGSVSTQA